MKFYHFEIAVFNNEDEDNPIVEYGIVAANGLSHATALVADSIGTDSENIIYIKVGLLGPDDDVLFLNEETVNKIKKNAQW